MKRIPRQVSVRARMCVSVTASLLMVSLAYNTQQGLCYLSFS